MGGICYDYLSEDQSCYIHKFGPHIFHTNSEDVWKFVNRFSTFNEYIHRGISKYNNKLYSFPVNFNTLFQVFGQRFYNKESVDKVIHDVYFENPKNFEEAALNAVGTKLYKMFIKNYAERQWKCDLKKLSADIFKRIDIRYNFNDTYFSDKFQGMPSNGYFNLLKEMITHKNISLYLNEDFNNFIDNYNLMIYTGGFDNLPYRSTNFIHYTDKPTDIPILNLPTNKIITRITNFNSLHYVSNSNIHHFCKEIPVKDNELNELLPVLTEENINLFNKKSNEFKLKYKNVVFCGRLATYKYLDMDKVILQAMNLIKENII